MRRYRGHNERTPAGGFRVEVVEEVAAPLWAGDGPGQPATRIRPLEPRNDLVDHSPDGFAWGYHGSGPAQLALALLADLVGDELALRHYQGFKDAVVAQLRIDEPWEIGEEQLRQALRAVTLGYRGARVDVRG